MAGVALVSIFPASRLPDYKPGEIPPEPFSKLGGATPPGVPQSERAA
jgi:hypothetical protein